MKLDGTRSTYIKYDSIYMKYLNMEMQSDRKNNNIGIGWSARKLSGVMVMLYILIGV